MKKKLLALLLAAGMAISLCACGDSGDSGATPVYDESPTVPDSSWATEEPDETADPCRPRALPIRKFPTLHRSSPNLISPRG